MPFLLRLPPLPLGDLGVLAIPFSELGAANFPGNDGSRKSGTRLDSLRCGTIRCHGCLSSFRVLFPARSYVCQEILPHPSEFAFPETV